MTLISMGVDDDRVQSFLPFVKHFSIEMGEKEKKKMMKGREESGGSLNKI